MGIAAVLYMKTPSVIAWPDFAQACSSCHDLDVGVTTTASVSELSLMPGETSQAFTITVNGAGYHQGLTGSALRLPFGWTGSEDYAFGNSTETDGEWYWTETREDPDHIEMFTATITVPTDATEGDYTIDVWGAGDNVDGNKASDSTTITVTVIVVSPPVASFTFSPESPIVDEEVTFNASTSHDADGTIVSYDWDFGDGTTGSGVTVAHTYTADGSYSVTLTVTDNDDLSDSATQEVTVSTLQLQPPVASFTFEPQTPVVNETVTFNATDSHDPDGTIISYDWDFGDGTILSEINPVAAHDYAVEGSYLVKLTVVDNDALNDTDTASITVSSAIEHDIKITNVTAFPTEVTIGDSLSINVDLENEGDMSETFNVTSYYDTTVIETKTVTDLASHSEVRLNFTWNTLGVSEGNYTIKAVASAVAGETDTDDNSYIDGTVSVTFALIGKASVDLDPDTLNLKSHGRWVSCYIELPEGYDVDDVDRATILLNGTIPVDPFWVDKPLESVVGDHDSDTILDLMVKFNRMSVSDYLLDHNVAFGNVTLTLTMQLYDGTPFEGSDTIKVLPKASRVSLKGAKSYGLVPNPLMFLFAVTVPVVFDRAKTVRKNVFAARPS